MSDLVEVWHYPRCSKSRQTLAILEELGVDFVERRYRQDTPSVSEIGAVLDKLGARPRDLIRDKEDAYQVLGLSDETLSDAELIGAMAEHPEIIERPVVIAGNRAAIGRPPESVRSLFDATELGS